MSQLHKRFTSDEVKELLERYLKNEIERKYIQEILGIKKVLYPYETVYIKNIFKISLSNIKEAPRHEFLQRSNKTS